MIRADAIWRLVSPVPEGQRTAATALLWASFPRKAPATMGRGDAGAAALAASLNLTRGIAALAGDELVGLCGLSSTSDAWLTHDLGALAQAAGWVRGLRAWLGVLVSQPRVPADVLYVQQLAVAAGWRGQGIGTALLCAAAARGRDEGRRALQLTVADSNWRARALYARLGFVATRTLRMPYLRRWLGYGALTRMARELD